MNILEDIIHQWETDSNIDTNNIKYHTIDTPKLHSKYIKILTDWKIKLVYYKNELARMKNLRIKYYRGELTRDELLKHNWSSWQFNKPLKNELETLLNADENIFKISSKIEEINVVIFALESILNQIKSRDFEISNYIKWTMFESGN